MINELPTVFEVVTGAPKQSRDADNNSNRKSKSSGKVIFYFIFFLKCGCVILFESE